MRVDVGALTSGLADAFPSFGVFDASINVITSLWPAGGAYNREPIVRMRGTFETADYGRPTCKFGNWTSSPVVNASGANHRLNATQLTCAKPRFPDSVRDAVGAYPVSFSPNGQCWPPSTTASFITYNAQVDAFDLTGAPATQSLPLEVRGQGFVQPVLPNAACRFVSHADGTVVTTTLYVLSPTRARCAGTPAGGMISTWRLEVVQNGMDADPSLYPLTLTTYDLAAVRVSALDPPGGPTGVETAVTVRGTGFATYGEVQLVCRIGGVNVPAVLLDVNRTLCKVPPLAAPAGVVVTVSLNNGTSGTLSSDATVFTAYHPPYLTSILPGEGDARGGTRVTVYGVGFTAISADASVRSGLLRCRFGGAQSPTVAALSHTDSSVV